MAPLTIAPPIVQPWAPISFHRPASSITKTYLVIVGTDRLGKVEDLDFAARETAFKFLPYHRVADTKQTSAEDLLDSKRHVEDKSRLLVPLGNKLTDTNTTEHLNLLLQCHAWNIPFDPNNLSNIFLLSEDTNTDIWQSLWPYLQKRLKGTLPDALVDKEKWQASEIGPAVTAVGGWPSYYALYTAAYREAAEKEGKSSVDIIMTTQSFAAFRGLANLDAEFMLEGKSSTRILQTPYKGFHYNTGALIDPYALVSTLDDPTPIAERREEYFGLNGDAPRSQIVRQLIERTSQDALGLSPVDLTLLIERTAKQVLQRRTGPQYVAVTTPKTNYERIYRLIANSSPILRTTQDQNAVVLYPSIHPSEPGGLTTRLNALSDIFDTVNHRQLEATHKHKPLIIIDDGSYARDIGLLNSAVNCAASENFVTYAPAYSGNGITHTATAYYDLLEYDGQQFDPEKMPKGTLLQVIEQLGIERSVQIDERIRGILEQRCIGYTGFQENAHPYEQEGELPTPSVFNVVHCFSASINNQRAHDIFKKFGATLGENGWAYTWGGMTKDICSVPARAYLEAGGRHVTAISTHAITALETKEGKLPNFANCRIYCPNYASRKALIVSSGDAMVFDFGGVGTIDEIIDSLRALHRMPEALRYRQIILNNYSIYHTDARFYDPLLQTLGSTERYRDFRSLVDPDRIWISYHPEETVEMLQSIESTWKQDRRLLQRPRSTPQGIVTPAKATLAP